MSRFFRIDMSPAIFSSTSSILRRRLSRPYLWRGWAEYLHWSPDGTRVLLGVAAHGAETSSGQGAVRSSRSCANRPSWTPTVEEADDDHSWRSVWTYEVRTRQLSRINVPGVNVWESVWCGDRAIAVVMSRRPMEGAWYEARMAVIELASTSIREVYAPRDQIGVPCANPSGSHLAWVEAIASDRGFIAGRLKLMDTRSGEIEAVDTRGVEVSYTEWRSERTLLLAGHRGVATVIGTYDVLGREVLESWRSREMTTAGLYAAAAGLGDSGDCVVVGESFTRAPEIAVIRGGAYRPLKSLAADTVHARTAGLESESVAWTAPDGLEIQGWLLRPPGGGPHPLVMWIHGGPVWHWRPRWLGRANVPILSLVAHGYAVFLPNPRGSDGQGQEFVRLVVGDMGGADTHDFLSGIDHLVARGIADPKRLGVIGVSYGGFMSAWLITQDCRFSAAIPVAPITNWVTEHLATNIPQWVTSFLEDSYRNPTGRYFERSPIMHAYKAKTPTLNICGALDRSAPPQEAVQFHNAFLEHGVNRCSLHTRKKGMGFASCLLPSIMLPELYLGSRNTCKPCKVRGGP